VTGAPHVEDLLRELAPQVLGVLVRRFGDFDAAEDAVQEALLSAAARWPEEGAPDNPRGWLIQTGSRKLLDHMRSEKARRRRESLADLREPRDARLTEQHDRDDTLTVLFMCCHPSLTAASAIALTLRAIGGLTTAEIASAFLVPEATMAQRISRAKRRVKESDAPFRLPAPAEWTQRLRSVLPDDGEVAGLLALMLLTDARRPARAGAGGELIPLDEQNQTLWDRALIAEGTALIDGAVARGAVGEYQLQAAIAALHARAARVEDTDWPQILALYGLLERMTGNPMVSLNRAIAAAMAHGPAEGLRLLDALDERLPGHHRLDAVRAHLYEMAGDAGAAGEHYRVAAARTTSAPERRYLIARAARLKAELDASDADNPT
jgi:RNA polymerase sigma factor (sigma-70 family)